MLFSGVLLVGGWWSGVASSVGRQEKFPRERAGTPGRGPPGGKESLSGDPQRTGAIGRWLPDTGRGYWCDGCFT